MVATYKKVYEAKRDEIDLNVEKMQEGLKVMAAAEMDSVKLKTAVTELQLLSEEKREEYESLKELMEKEEVRCDKEEAKVADFEGYVAKILEDCEAQREIIVGDLNRAIPFIEAMKGCVESIERADVGVTAKMNKLPHGYVDDVFGALVVLFCQTPGLGKAIVPDKKGKVDDRSRGWASARVTLLGNVNAFIDGLGRYKQHVETGDVPAVNMKDVRRYLVLEHFKRPEALLEEHSTVAAILATWAQNIVQYYDVIQMVEPKRQVLPQR